MIKLLEIVTTVVIVFLGSKISDYYKADLIEIQLSHLPANKVRAAYNHAEYLDERRLMMQEWSDYLDKLQNKESVSTLTYQQSLF